MNKTLSIGLLVFSVGAAASCSDDPVVDTAPYCSASTGAICEPAGLPFVTEASFRSDACPTALPCAKPLSATTAALTEPAPGQVCLKGTVTAPAGFSWLVLHVSHWNQALTHIVDVLDARALGITGVQFDVVRPPTAGLNLFADAAHTRDCDVPRDCLNGWDLMSGPRSNLVKVLDKSETVTAPFTDFSNPDPTVIFDPTQLSHFIFVVQPGDYDFCIANFKFLNSSGVEILPAGFTIDASTTEVEPDAPDGGATGG